MAKKLEQQTGATRKLIDWEAIEREYRAGQLSIIEIAFRFKCRRETITRKAKALKWSRDLAAAVRKATANKVTRVTSQVTSDNATEREIVEAAAERAKNVIVLHRKDIAKLREVEQKLLAELDDNPQKIWVGQHQGVVITKALSIAVTERASAYQALAAAAHKRILLERQAYSLDDAIEPKDKIDKINITFVDSKEL